MTDRPTASTINDEQLDALYAEVDRLRAGEEDGYDPAALPTPGQWMKRYNDATAEERHDQVTHLIKAADHGHACMMHMHEVHIRDGREAEAAVRRVCTLIAGRWGKVDPDLVRAALDGTEQPTGASLPASTHPAAAAHPLVQGRCPACGWSSLFLGDGGHATCARIDCPNPCAADDLLHSSDNHGAWQPQHDGSWTLDIGDERGVITMPRRTSMRERALFAAAWAAMSSTPTLPPAATEATQPEEQH